MVYLQLTLSIWIKLKHNRQIFSSHIECYKSIMFWCALVKRNKRYKDKRDLTTVCSEYSRDERQFAWHCFHCPYKHMAPFDAVIPLSEGFGPCNNGHCYCVDTQNFLFLYSFILWLCKELKYRLRFLNLFWKQYILYTDGMRMILLVILNYSSS